MAVKVGSFAKSTGGAPVSQAVTGVGFTPRALILWTGNNTSSDSFGASAYLGFGMSTASESYAIATAIQDNVTPTNTGRNQAAKALTMCSYDGSTVLYECDLSSFDSDGFTLNWTTNDGNAVIVHYMALGGPNFTDAKIVTWTCPTSTGNKAVTGAGFQPDCVFHFGIMTSGAFPTTTTNAKFNLGVMTTSAQWFGGLTETDNDSNNDPLRTFTSSRVLQQLGDSSVNNYATYVSMDADGFTVNFGDAASAAWYMASLCLKGGSYYVGRQTKSSGTGNEAYTGVGFQPEGLLIINSSGQLDGSSPNGDIMLNISATDGTSEQSALIVSEDLGSSTADNASSLDSTTKIVIGDVDANQSINDEADIVSLDADGFTLNRTTSASNLYMFVFGFNGGAVPTGQPIALRDWVKHTGRPWKPGRGL